MIKVPVHPKAYRIRNAQRRHQRQCHLLFAQAVYGKLRTFIDGVEKFAATGGDVSKLGACELLISRIDSLVDSLVGRKLKAETDAAAKELQGSRKGAIANAS